MTVTEAYRLYDEVESGKAIPIRISARLHDCGVTVHMERHDERAFSLSFCWPSRSHLAAPTCHMACLIREDTKCSVNTLHRIQKTTTSEQFVPVTAALMHSARSVRTGRWMAAAERQAHCIDGCGSGRVGRRRRKRTCAGRMTVSLTLTGAIRNHTTSSKHRTMTMASTELAAHAAASAASGKFSRCARLLAMSNYFDAKGNGEQAIAQLATKILAGQEMGYGPFASVQGIHVIQGKPTMWPTSWLAQSRTRHAMTIVCARWKTPPSASNL